MFILISTINLKMNRLILIGNGFDLVHGIKMNYNDFMDNILVNTNLKEDEDPNFTLVLNFNYTKTPKNILAQTI